eukprot:TRINITY_DN23724_c0_g2_i1.p1 TRINITY_DN23724_c0_g2~~TRINITY_DN23724_c0_g2_i1.p1  ORF type:complete len:624 (-),score=28.83 TRINITY_DN23724_c0_g2_i1:299-2170(-)
MAVSYGAVVLLLSLCSLGPVLWAIAFVWKRHKRDVADGSGGSSASSTSSSVGSNEGNTSRTQATSSPACRSSNALAKADREELSTSAYTISLLGYAIGIGNVWRFPYLVGRHGGCAFIVAYLVCLFFVAIPMYLMEFVIGQYTRRSTMNCFKMLHPRWVGLGWGQAVMLFFCLGYYNVLLAYSCIYLYSSLSSPLPWHNRSAAFWMIDVLNSYPEKEGFGFGPLQVQTVVALLWVWTILFVSLAFGKHVLEKVTWITVVGPILLMCVLLIRVSQLNGAWEGVVFYIGKFDGALLLSPDLWAIACGQILFSLSPGFGTAITMSSYTKKNEDVFRVCWIVALCNSAFSLTAGFAIFGILGNLALRSGQTVEELASASGPGLAFVVIAEGMSYWGPLANVMAVLFFLMLFTLGLDSTFAWLETFVSYLADFCEAHNMKLARWKIVLLSCLLFFTCGLPYCTRRGIDLLDIIDHYCASYFLLFGCCAECIMFTIDFGWPRFELAIKHATIGNTRTPKGRDLSFPRFWRFCLSCLIPIVTISLFFQLLWRDFTTPFQNYDSGFQAIGWCVLCMCLTVTPLTFFRKGHTSLRPLADEQKRFREELSRREATTLVKSDGRDGASAEVHVA